MKRFFSCSMRIAPMLMLCLAALAHPALANKSNDTLEVAFTKELPTVDRFYSVLREGLIVSRLTDDGLFAVDPNTLDYVPLAAKSYNYVDEKTLDVTVREGVRFHDGSPLTADDVVYTYQKYVDPAMKTKRGTIIARWLDRVEKRSAMVVRFHMKHPYPLALRDMAVTVPLRKVGTYDTKEGAERSAVAVNGIGPYKVVEFEPGKKVVLERFEGYYKGSAKGRPAIKRIVFRTIPDEGTQQAEIMSGGIQFMFAVPTDVAENIAKSGRVKALYGPDVRTVFLILDAAGYTAKDNPLTRLEVRRAINYAIDRKTIVKTLVRGASVPIPTPCHPIQFGCTQDVREYPFDPAKARELIKKAGYPNGFTMDLWAYRDKPVAEAIVGMLSNANIKVNLRYVKLSVLAKARASRETQAIIATWGAGGTADASATLGTHFASDSNRNWTRDKQVSDWVMAAEATVDKAKRVELYRKALQRIAEQAYLAPVYGFTQNYLLSPDLVLATPKDGVPRLYLAKWE